MPAPYLDRGCPRRPCLQRLLARTRPSTSLGQSKRAQSEPANPSNGSATVGLDDFLAGNVRVIFATIYVSPKRRFQHARQNIQDRRGSEHAGAGAAGILCAAGSDPRISLITIESDLRTLSNGTEPKIGLVLLMEGADPIIEPQRAGRVVRGGRAHHRSRVESNAL